MFIQKRKEGEPRALPRIVPIDYMNEQNRETIRRTGNSVRNATLLPEAVKNRGDADLFLAAAKNSKRLSLSELSKNFRSLISKLA